jgi:hypothetical protein
MPRARSQRATGRMCARSSLFDAIWFVSLNVFTVGAVCAALCAAVLLVARLDLTPLDLSVLVWMIVGLCASSVVFASSLYIVCCNLRCGKLALAIWYTAFDLLILGLAIGVLALDSSELLKQIGRMWTDESDSAIVLFVEERLDCCGFNRRPAHDCGARAQSCFNVLTQMLTDHGPEAGGILIAAFLLLLVGVVISYIRALRRAPQAAEITALNERLTAESVNWF